MKRIFAYISEYNLAILFWIIIIAFLIPLFYLMHIGNTFLDAFLTAAAISGMFGLLTEVISNLIERKKQLIDRRICYVSNDSTFSNRIYEGIESFVGKNNLNLILVRHKITKDDELLSFLEREAYQYRGLIIRNKQFSKHIITALNKYMDSWHFVEFVDTDSIQKKAPIRESLRNNWHLANSDLEMGANLIVAAIKDKIAELKPSNYRFIFFDGPDNNPNSRKRCDIIRQYAIEHSRKSIIIPIKQLKKEDFFNLLEEHTKEISDDGASLNINELKKEKVSAIFIFCGNDQNAYDLMHALNQRHSEITYLKYILKTICGPDYSRLYIIGYDGLRDADLQFVSSQHYKLGTFNDEFNYMTIDAHPDLQGQQAVKDLHLLMQNAVLNENYSSVIPTSVYSKRWSTIKQKIFVFDLDGTIADTEVFHLQAYKELLMRKYKIKFADEEFEQYIGKRESVIHQMIRDKHHLQQYDIEQMTQERLDIFLELCGNLQPFPSIMDFINMFDKTKYIISSQRRDIIDRLLAQWDLTEVFKDRILSCAELNISKEEILANLGAFIPNTQKEDILWFEDSVSFIQKLINTPIATVGICHSLNISQYSIELIKSCDRILVQI